MTDTAIKRQQLAELEAARHALLTGKARVSVGHDGKSVTYTKTTLADLNAAIMGLKSELGLGRRRAIGVRF